MSEHAEVHRRAQEALTRALAATKGHGVFAAEPPGYVARVRDNLVDGVTEELFQADFGGAAGHEMESKMKAAHSSSALAVNTFAPWKRETQELGRLHLGCETDFTDLTFEAKCPTGLSGTPPHLDLLLRRSGAVLGVESKCLEYLGLKKQEYSDSYAPLLQKYPHLKRVAEAGDQYRHLDAAQLVKHVLGLIHTYPSEQRMLLYLFWEPVNWQEFQVFKDHRAEVRRFAEMVQGGEVQFRAMTYRQIWDEWSLQAGPGWLAQHGERLRERYDVVI